MCDGTAGIGEGGWSTCQLDYPMALIHYGDFLYVGSSANSKPVLMDVAGNCVSEIAADTTLYAELNLKQVLANYRERCCLAKCRA